MLKRILLPTIVFCLIFIQIGCSDAQQGAITTGPMRGQLAPDFTLKDLSGKEFSLSSFRDKNVVCLVFWATWCPYCLKEIPRLKEFHKNLSDKGLKVISVDIAANDPIKRVKYFKEKEKIPYPILYDTDSLTSRIYGVSGIPVSIIIDRKGIIQYRGYTLPDNVEALFKQLLL